MCGIVLIQESKGGGLASSFSSANQLSGVRKTTDFLEKATWGLAIAMAVLSITSAAFNKKSSADDAIEIVAPQTDANNMQSFPTTGGSTEQAAPANDAAAPVNEAAATEKAE